MKLEEWKRVLVFGAHVDDEVLGPGATIARLADLGAEVTVVTFTGGKDTGYALPEWKDKITEMRKQEAAAADRILGVKERVYLGHPVQEVPNDGPTYRECVRIIRELKPDVIFTHWFEDKHRDHRAVSAVTDEARWKAWDHVLADLGAPYWTPQLYYYELLELFPHPSIIVDVTDTIERKVAAMEQMPTQLRVLPRSPEFIRALGAARGYLRDRPYAEAFLASNLMSTAL